jgi:subtilisin family serine protease
MAALALVLLAGMVLARPVGATDLPPLADDPAAGTDPVADDVHRALRRSGSAHVIITLRGDTAPPVDRPGRDRLRQRKAALAERLPDGVALRADDLERNSTHLGATVDTEGLEALAADPAVASVVENGIRRLSLATTTGTVGAPTAWAAGYGGSGRSVAVLDTGVQADHPFLAGRVVAQACFSGGGIVHPAVQPICASPPDVAAPCSLAELAGCDHGTHVAGIVAGSNGPGTSPSGVAPDVDVVAIQVFTRIDDGTFCGATFSCIVALDSDILAALDWVHTNRVTHSIAAANLSLGGGSFSGTCDTIAGGNYRAKFDLLRAGGVAPVVASGNDSDPNRMSAPGCVSSAVAVGAVQADTLNVAGFSNSSPALDLLAPGARTASGSGGVRSSVPGGGYAAFKGTSMATPHVAGAFALLKQARPTMTVDAAEALLKATGRAITDGRQGRITPLLAVDEAVVPPRGTFHPLTPARVLDTRSGVGAPKARVGAAKRIDVQITGRGGVPSTGVSAVVFNLTAVNPSAGGFVTAWPSESVRPLASNLNLKAADVRPNLVTVRLRSSGKVSLFNATGTVDLVGDVVGWYDTAPANSGGRFHAVEPVRILDTRNGTGAPAGKLGPGATLTATAAGGALPAPLGATAAVVNLTVVDPTVGTYITAFPTSSATPPLASNLNAGPGQTRPNLAIVPLDADGRFRLYNNLGTVHLVADLQGWFGPGPGGAFVPTAPTRLLDTRVNLGAPGPLGPDQVRLLQVSGTALPGDGITAVVLNATAVQPTGVGFVTVFPSDPRPLASNLNLETGVDTPNLVTSALDGMGRVRLYNAANSVHLAADLAGYYIDDT